MFNFKSAVLGLVVVSSFSTSVYGVARVDLMYRLGDEKISYEGRVLLPIFKKENFLLFNDIRIINTNNVSYQLDLGIAARGYLEGTNSVLGVYYSYNHQHTGLAFKQDTFGVELLGSFFEARMNVYKPLTSNYLVLINDHIGMKTNAVEGKDFEFGVKFPMHTENNSLWLYWGGYNFSNNGFVDEGKNVRAKVGISINNGLSVVFGAEAKYSSQATVNQSFTVKLGMPLRKQTQSCLGRSIERQHGIKINSEAVGTGEDNYINDEKHHIILLNS